MAVITTGSAPKALIGAMQPNVYQSSPGTPLEAVADRFVPKPKKPPKIKKHAFGPSKTGAAFRK